MVKDSKTSSCHTMHHYINIFGIFHKEGFLFSFRAPSRSRLGCRIGGRLEAVVLRIPAGSKAEEAGLMPGDRLEARRFGSWEVGWLGVFMVLFGF